MVTAMVTATATATEFSVVLSGPNSQYPLGSGAGRYRIGSGI